MIVLKIIHFIFRKKIYFYYIIMIKDYYNFSSEKKNIAPVPYNSILEPFFEGEIGEKGPFGPRGLRGDRGMRGSAGPSGPSGPKGPGISEADMEARTLWCRNENNCATPNNIVARFRKDAYLQIGPNTNGGKSLVVGGNNRPSTGEPSIHTKNNNLYLDAGNAYGNTQDPGNTYINLDNKGKTYINQDGHNTLINDKKGYVGINMNGSEPKNNLHIKGDQPLTIEHNGKKGSAGIIFKASTDLQAGGQNWTVGANDLGLYMYDNNVEQYNYVAKDGSVGVGTDKPNKNFTLDVDGHGRFRQDFRMSGGPGASVQLNWNKNEGERSEWIKYNSDNEIESCDITQGLEFIGGDNSRSKINFFGNEMDIQYGPLNKVLINFDKNGVNFVGPIKFKDTVTFEGPIDKKGSNKSNYSFKVLEDTLFEGNNFHKGTSYWGTKDDGSLDERWMRIESNMLQTNNGLRLYDPDDSSNTKFADITYSNSDKISSGTEISGRNIATGAIVVENNLIVKGSATGDTRGIEAPLIKSEFLESDTIRTSGAIQYSDKRLKENITKINENENIDRIMKMQGYNYINKITKQNDSGLIAQQIEKIDKNLVDNNGKYKGIKYNNIIPMLVEAVKFQQKEINKLKTQ